MKKRLLSLILITVVALALPLSAKKKRSAKDLPAQYRKWLEEDVAYIISKKEADVFLQLSSDRERDIFINAFWKQRDPTPGTTENEFRTEHYRRIAHANQWFGRDSPLPGWRTDMGRTYIQLGQPKEIQYYENLVEIYPTITWFYDGMIEYNLPNSFYVVFFKRGGIGDYELYSPIKHGPQNLLIHYKGDMTRYEDAYSELLGIEPQLATVSLSLIEGEYSGQISPSLASQVLLDVRIPSAPYEKVKTAYADKLLKYKDIIEVEYSANYMDSQTVIAVFQDRSGLSFVHYAIEPRRLSFEEYQGRYHAEIEINGKVSDESGITIFQFDRTVPVDMDAEQIEKIKAKLFSFQDLFPLLPGRYKLDILFKNRVSQEFSTVDADLIVPEAGQFSISQPILSNKSDPNSKYKGANKAFLLSGIQLVPSPRNDFSPGDKMFVYFQVQALPLDLKETGRVLFTILKDQQAVHSLSRNLSEYPDLPDIYEEFSLNGYVPAHYELAVSIQDASKAERLSATVPFYVSSVAYLPRPWVLSLPQPPSRDPSFANILGRQYLSRKNLMKARPLLEAAHRAAPDSENYALDYCQVLMLTRDYAGIKQTVQPFLMDEKSRPGFLQVAGQASQAMGELAEAIVYYQDYLAHFGTNIIVLNAIGECYLQLGNPAEALVAWEKSLEIEPKQDKLRERVKALKEKK